MPTQILFFCIPVTLILPHAVFIVIPPAFATRLKTSDLRAVSVTGDAKSPLRNGALGSLDRFLVLQSNLLSHAIDGQVDAYNVVFGWNQALAFASTITKTEKIRSETFFGNLTRGLVVYGYQVINPEALGLLYCDFA